MAVEMRRVPGHKSGGQASLLQTSNTASHTRGGYKVARL